MFWGLGSFVLNCPWKPEELDEKLPATLRRQIARKRAKFYIIDAINIASNIGLGNRINMIMQSAFFKLANVIPVEDAVNYLKTSIEKTYGKKGQKIVDMNKAAVDRGSTALVKVDFPSAWAEAEDEVKPLKEEPDFVKQVKKPMERNEGTYSPCINHGIRSGMGTSILEEKRAVEAGYWHLYRYNPMLKADGKNPFILDSKEPSASFKDFLTNEIRYSALTNTFPEIANEMFSVAEDHARERYLTYKRLAEMQY